MRRRKPWWIKTIYDVAPDKIIRLKNQDGPIGETWLAREFVRVLEEAGEKGRLSRARNCARTGSGSSLRVEPGEMRIGICCSGYTIRDVHFWFPKFKDDIWERFVKIVAADAALTGALLAGDFSEYFIDGLKKEKIFLLPKKFKDLSKYCQCGDDHDPCIHNAVAWYLFAEELDENPWHLLTLRGLHKEEVIKRVRVYRDIQPSLTHKISIPREKVTGKGTDILIPNTVHPIGFFSMSGGRKSLPDMQQDTQEMNPTTLLGLAPFKLGGKNLAERIERLYPVIREYARNFGKEEE
ncbi:MAG: hypothetical protein V1862_13185 [Methanobacteriota archaeon]